MLRNLTTAGILMNQQQRANTLANANRNHQYHKMLQDARAARLQSEYGDRFLGMTLDGKPILKGETNVPIVRRVRQSE